MSPLQPYRACAHPLSAYITYWIEPGYFELGQVLVVRYSVLITYSISLWQEKAHDK